jgi:hypothetical protein
MKGLTIEQMEFLVGKGLDAGDMIAFAKMSQARNANAERQARWRARKRGVTNNVTDNALPPPIDNHTPPVSSDEETKPAPKTRRKVVLAAKPEAVTDPVWRDFTGQRKTPVTETALDGICEEAAKAGWTLNRALAEAATRGWQSFKAEWVEKPPGKAGANDPADFLAHLVAKQSRQS